MCEPGAPLTHHHHDASRCTAHPDGRLVAPRTAVDGTPAPTPDARNGTGIGAGIIIGGEPFTGSAGFAGEVGRMTVDAHGPLGLSTMPGALESL